MYYIIAEASTDATEALDAINKVLYNRGLTELPNNDNLASTVQEEYKREFWGEGQTFFLHKRLNTDYLWIDEAGYNYNGANYFEFTIPLPAGEIENR